VASDNDITKNFRKKIFVWLWRVTSFLEKDIKKLRTTCETSKECIGKYLIGNRFHVALRTYRQSFNLIIWYYWISNFRFPFWKKWFEKTA